MTVAMKVVTTIHSQRKYNRYPPCWRSLEYAMSSVM